DMQASRPANQHRLSTSATPSSTLPVRPSSSRHHSHSVSLGAINPSHRVTRRKSMTSTAANNVAAMAAALNEAGEGSFGTNMPSTRRGMTSGRGNGVKSTESTSGGGASGSSGYPSPSSNGPSHVKASSTTSNARDSRRGGSAIADDLPPSNGLDNVANNKGRGRRASEGAHLVKGEGKSASGGELRCEQCGKGWEHTPEWSYTSKLLISKHQQVQLLEAASVLVAMNQDGTTPPELAKNADSDHSSASPAASGYSELHDDDISSVETTPPPLSEDQVSAPNSSKFGRSKRYSSYSSAYSRSYQSAPSSSVFTGSAPSGSSGFGHYRQQSSEYWPSTPGAGLALHGVEDEDEAGLVAAVESLCNFGTPRTGPVHLPPDVPPVPPLPAKFLGQNLHGISGSTSTPTIHHSLGMPLLTHQLSQERDVRMWEDDRNLSDDDDSHQRSALRARSDEDDDGVFGRMEE
ncbi:MAG: hypothetical protein M1830_001206, partial [Pleopsidium flavum]